MRTFTITLLLLIAPFMLHAETIDPHQPPLVLIEFSPLLLTKEPMTFGASAQIQFSWDLTNQHFTNAGLEYRAGDKAWMLFADHMYHFVEGPSPVGPMVTGGVGFGVAGADRSRPALDLRAGLGYTIPLSWRYGITPQVQYRRSINDVFGSATSKNDLLVGVGFHLTLK